MLIAAYRFSTLLTVILLALVAALPQQAQSQSHPSGEIVEVRMVDKGSGQWRFDPAHVSVERGDLVRFVQDDVVPHNVEFKETPDGSDLDGIVMGSFLMTKGETYELAIDARFAAGDHAYVCTPHEGMGMTGVLTVENVSPAASTK